MRDVKVARLPFQQIGHAFSALALSPSKRNGGIRQIGHGQSLSPRVRDHEIADAIRPLRSSYERGCQGKKLLPAPLGDAGVVTYIQPSHSRKGDWLAALAALARRRLQRRCRPQLLVPTRRFHEVSGARHHSVPKLRKLNVG